MLKLSDKTFVMEMNSREADVQGNCSTEVAFTPSGTHAPIASPLPGQCLIVTDHPLLEVTVNLWLDALYIRHQTTARTATNTAYSLLRCESVYCNLWMTSVALQGDGIEEWEQVNNGTDPILGALEVSGGQLYAEGAVSAHQ